ncbi:putative sugar O-methyltransferase [Lentzea californiensis]|uniref:putative sugar O-methyltransferase n=1 Tax=Lentzea californiensis TaxID=438851 RepID=UPI0021662F20|nr:putative sugar O-methyltransferase [Lentzea californiensis]MCR3752071.1 putative sugar O-methyltransferase [Lentzea californiensis]
MLEHSCGRGEHDPTTPLPPGAAEQLIWENPKLLDLVRRYDEVVSPLNTHSHWADVYRSDLDLRYFRGDNCYVRQLSNYSADLESSMVRYARYLAEFDHRKLMERLTEDGRFGCWTAAGPSGTPISRDLLDSVNEICFLDREWQLFDRPGCTVIDVGAGYGRLAHRMAVAVDDLDRYYCVDAVPTSTFVCSYYLEHRGVGKKAPTIPLDRLDELDDTRIDLAVNIHSFAEMPRTAVDAWLGWLSRHDVGHLFLITNTQDTLNSREGGGVWRDATPLLAEHGYHRIRSEIIIRDEPLRLDLGVDDHFQLYELRA